MTALRLIQLAIGWEWLASGLTKLAHGDFPGGLASQIRGMDASAPGWFRGVLGAVVLPHAAAWGYAIEVGEVAIGAVLIVTALRSPGWLRRLAPVGLVAGALLAACFALASGSTFGLGLAGDSFDEGVDLDTLLVPLQLALAGYWIAQLPIWNSRKTSLRLVLRSVCSFRQPTIKAQPS
jgi:uncharacterized membrane protein YphA (DoxX/SURF4 family)